MEQAESQEILAHPEQIGVVTTTLYPHYGATNGDQATIQTLRGDLALRTFVEAQERGYPVFVSDGGSSKIFLQKLAATGVTMVPKPTGGRADQKCLLYAHAHEHPGVQVICWIEPEKCSMIEDDCMLRAADPIVRGEADIVVPARDAAGWESYPPYQVHSEKNANATYNRLLHTEGMLKDDFDLDHFFGPRLFANTPEMLELFSRNFMFVPKETSKVQRLVSVDRYSNSTYFPVVQALAEGRRVHSVTVPFRLPPEQRAMEMEMDTALFNRHRDVQRRTILTELVHLLKSTKNAPSRLQRGQ